MLHVVAIVLLLVVSFFLVFLLLFSSFCSFFLIIMVVYFSFLFFLFLFCFLVGWFLMLHARNCSSSNRFCFRILPNMVGMIPCQLGQCSSKVGESLRFLSSFWRLDMEGGTHRWEPASLAQVGALELISSFVKAGVQHRDPDVRWCCCLVLALFNQK